MSVGFKSKSDRVVSLVMTAISGASEKVLGSSVLHEMVALVCTTGVDTRMNRGLLHF